MKLIRNLAYLSSAELVSKVVTFAAIAYLARILGPVNFGYIEFAGSVMLCAGLIVDQGFGPYGAREIAKKPSRTGELFTEIVLVRLLLALFAYGAVAVFALTVGRSALVTRLLFLYGLSLLGMPLLLQWVFQGHDRMRTAAAINLIRQATYAVVVFAFVHTAEQIGLVAIAEVAGVALGAFIGLWQYRRQFGSTRWQVRISPSLFREGVPIGLSQLFWMARMYGATVFLGLIASPQDVGFFSAAMRILVALHAFIYLYYFNLLPSLSRAWQQSASRMGPIITGSLRRLIWASLIIGLAWVILAPFVITAAYGPAFGPAGETLQVLAGVGTVALISGHYRFGLIAAGRQKAELVCQVLGSGIALALLPLGYAQHGPAGAAMALMVAEIAVWLCAWYWARARLGLCGHAILFLKPAAVLVAALGLLFFLPPSPIIRLVAAVAAVAILALASDEIMRNDVRQIGMMMLHMLRKLWLKRAVEGT